MEASATSGRERSAANEEGGEKRAPSPMTGPESRTQPPPPQADPFPAPSAPRRPDRSPAVETAADEAERHMIRAVARGDHLAFELLVKRYRAPVCSFVHRILGEHQQAEDITQEVFLRVYRSAATWQPPGRVSAWIFKIAYNLTLNEVKRRGRWSRIRTLLHLGQREEAMPVSPDPVEAEEFQSDLAAALLELPENQRAALLLRVNEGLAYTDIAGVLSLSVSAVESLIWRARTHLRKRLEGHRE